MTSERSKQLRELETRLRSTFGAWNHYRLRVWQQCRSIDAAGVEVRIMIAKEVLAATHRGDWVWALGGWHMLLGEIQSKLNDPDPHIRQDAAIALADLGPRACAAIPLLLDRLSSPTETLHDRACAAWALPRLGLDRDQAVPIFLQVLNEAADQADAGELRFRAAEAIEALSDSFRTLVPVARRSVEDRYWKVRLFGLTLVERLGKRSRRVLEMLIGNVKPLLDDDLEEIRVVARQIANDFAKDELQN